MAMGSNPATRCACLVQIDLSSAYRPGPGLMLFSPAHIATWCIAASAVVGLIVRPGQLPEALWAVLAALALGVFSLISWPDAARAVLKGTDVYLFLAGMMLLAELARHEGLFDWLAAFAVRRAKGSPTRLFALVYLVGTIVTIFLSNDATAVVLTPAVYAAAKQANAKPLPYLFICAMIANAASFVLPISNPANLVVYGAHMPSLATWLAEFGLASMVSIVVTFGVLRISQRRELTGEISRDIPIPALSLGGRIAAAGIGFTAIALLIASSLDWQLGLPTFLAGAITALAIMILNRLSPWAIARDISWSVLPLVAGLFVLVAAVEGTGALKPLITWLPSSASASPRATALVTGSIVSVLCNLLNNLPLGHCRRQRSIVTACHWRSADWRGSRTQFIGIRIARHYLVARRAAPRRTKGKRLEVLEVGLPRDAASAHRIARDLYIATNSLTEIAMEKLSAVWLNPIILGSQLRLHEVALAIFESPSDFRIFTTCATQRAKIRTAITPNDFKTRGSCGDEANGALTGSRVSVSLIAGTIEKNKLPESPKVSMYLLVRILEKRIKKPTNKEVKVNRVRT
jgi:arsenical pump membrane protein